jgi:energy-coupling factor transport system substrate-specific component
MSWRRWVLIGVLGALAGAVRVPFAFVPGVQPSTALVIVAGLALGARVGLGVGVMVPLVSNAFLGHGPWTPFQMLAWGLVGLLSGCLPRLPRVVMAAWGAVAAMLFGLIMDAWLWAAFAYPRELATLVPVLVRGVPFNVAHAAATAGVLVWVGPRLQTLLGRARLRILGEPESASPAAGPLEPSVGSRAGPTH